MSLVELKLFPEFHGLQHKALRFCWNLTSDVKPNDFNKDIKQLTEQFVGREWAFKGIDQWLQQKNNRFLVLLREPSVGKSTIAAHLTQTRENIVAYHFCQATDLNTLKPGQIVRSLSAQLMKHKEALPGYGQALLNTIKSPTLAAKVEITYQKATNSEITEVFIGNLKSSNEGKEGQEDLDSLLEILIRAPLAALGDFQGSLPDRAIFLIDGLEVAVSSAAAAQDDEDIVTLLANFSEAENLPSWVQFILTSRPDRRVLREFEPLQLYKSEAKTQNSDAQTKAVILPNCQYKLSEMSYENQADIRQYIEQRVKQPAFQPLLATAQMSEQTLVEALTEQAQGNFRYVRCVLDELESGTQSPRQLSVLPESLKQIYAQEWFVAASGNECQSILRTIANAKEFLTEDELVSRTKLRPRLVRQALWGLRQFLDVGTKPDPESRDKDGKEVEPVDTFAIFHPSLREYLLNQKPE
ncbi:hypothetical protein [Phormidium tenue]|uniref:Orc1-like AAA ATPase domain-containing protein n=1 Tax=Phormidium tenue NIES-30 TaxID=549789 RepID=A0A1U7IXX5_9CYAN|nr:hypothetical protein [Phormidium tenue]MBD2234984.1 hypothetical protein [Phormidium tenue FACHB-1052]OKH43149.1 hypothetical protein NIES30_25520 [Phormidium tenue NIES-30]